tara:strand:+ start:1757 stop:2410 length:654 start_codon:yes stop_codon:yes gene_type:complete
MKVELTIPSSLSEISLKQYQKFLKIQEKNDDSYFLQCKMIEIFCNLDAKTVRLLKFTDANKVIQILSDMFEEKPNLTHTFELGGIEYGFIPNLDSMSLGEYIDLDTYMGDWQNMQIAMNVLYRPIKEKIGDKYLIKDYDIESKEVMKDMPVDIVLGSVFFFYNLGIELSKTMMDSLEDKQMESWTEHLTFQENGGGMKASSLHSLKTMLDELKISLN